MAPDPPEAGLYSVPPEEFVRERNALAKSLRDDGKKSEADRVRKLRKPSVPAWAVNRAALDEPARAKALLESGERLADAQGAAASEGGGQALREAMAAHQDAVEGLMAAVEEALRSGGHDSAANADRARETLRALATDEELRAEFEAASVTRDCEPVGFGSAPAPRAAPRPKRDPARKRRDAAARKKLERAEAAAAKAVERARARTEKAEAALESAQAALKEARAALEAAEAEHERAAAELESAP